MTTLAHSTLNGDEHIGLVAIVCMERDVAPANVEILESSFDQTPKLS